jgi:hypothetical protein
MKHSKGFSMAVFGYTSYDSDTTRSDRRSLLQKGKLCKKLSLTNGVWPDSNYAIQYTWINFYYSNSTPHLTNSFTMWMHIWVKNRMDGVKLAKAHTHTTNVTQLRISK